MNRLLLSICFLAVASATTFYLDVVSVLYSDAECTIEMDGAAVVASAKADTDTDADTTLCSASNSGSTITVSMAMSMDTSQWGTDTPCAMITSGTPLNECRATNDYFEKSSKFECSIVDSLECTATTVGDSDGDVASPAEAGTGTSSDGESAAMTMFKITMESTVYSDSECTTEMTPEEAAALVVEAEADAGDFDFCSISNSGATLSGVMMMAMDTSALGTETPCAMIEQGSPLNKCKQSDGHSEKYSNFECLVVDSVVCPATATASNAGTSTLSAVVLLFISASLM